MSFSSLSLFTRHHTQTTSPHITQEERERETHDSHDLRRSRTVFVLWLLAAVAAMAMGSWLKRQRALTAAEQGIVARIMHAPSAVTFMAHVFQLLFLPPVVVVMLLVLLAVVLHISRSVATTVRYALTMAVPLCFALITKIVVARPRPITAIGVGSRDWSFPSGHTACSVVVTLSIISAIRLWSDRRPSHRSFAAARLALLLLPLATAYSRLVVGAHFPSDVLTSLVICSGLYYATRRLLLSMHGHVDAFGAPFRRA